MAKINLKSPLLNKSAIAEAIQMSPQTFIDKIKGRGSAKPFTDWELENIERTIKKSLNL